MKILIPFFVIALVLGGAGSVSAQTLLYQTFGSGTAPGWTESGGSWALAMATAGGGVCGTGLAFPSPASDASGDPGGYCAQTVVGGNLPLTGGVWHWLTSPVVDTSNERTLQFAYERVLNAGTLTTAAVEVFDGNSWVTVFTGSDVYESAWSRHSVDVTAHRNANFRVRFGFKTDTGYTGECSGWNVDNVRIYNKGMFYKRFENGSGWTFEGDWEFGAATAGIDPGCGNDDPDRDADSVLGGGVAGVNIGGGISNLITGPHFLTSPVYDTTDLVQPKLAFDRFLNSDYLPYMSSRVEVFDGTAWQILWEVGFNTVYDSDWVHRVYSLVPYSNPNLQVRFGYEVFAGAFSHCDSWNVDNVQIFDDVGFGQAPTLGAAVLDVSNATMTIGSSVYTPLSGQPGPYGSKVSESTGSLDFAFLGAPLTPLILVGGMPTLGATPLPPFGQIDVGLPGLLGLDYIGVGIEPGFFNSIFVLDGTGARTLSLPVPVGLAGTNYAFQAVMLDPVLLLAFSNAVYVTFDS